MPDPFTFAKAYFEGFGEDINKEMAGLVVNLRSQLVFRGKKVPFDDFTKFVKRGKSFVPLFCCSDVTEKDYVLDLYPVINAGMAELLALQSDFCNFFDNKFIDWIYENCDLDDWSKSLETVSAWKDTPYEGHPELVLLDTMRGSIIDYRFPVIRRIYKLLGAVKVINPKFYCVAVIEILKLALVSVPIFWGEDKSDVNQILAKKMMNAHKWESENLQHVMRQRAAWQMATANKLTRFGAIEYYSESEKKKRHITDCRGAGIYLLLILANDVFREFGDCVGEDIYNGSVRERFEGFFNQCLGDDWVGRLLKHGRAPILSCEKDIIETCREADLLPADCHKTLHHGEFVVGRGFEEAMILWKHATGAGDAECTGVLPPADVSYGSHVDIVCLCREIISIYTDLIIDERVAKAKAQAIKEFDVEAIVAPHKREFEKTLRETVSGVRAEVDKSKAENAELAAEIALLKQQLADKQCVIDQLREELSIANAKVRNIYSDDDFQEEDAVEESEVSAEEMLKFVNQFRIAIIGGIETLKPRLEQAGFTNLYFVQSKNSTGVVADFFCVCASFVSHKLVWNYENNYRDQLDSFFYFNGTNSDVFLKVCYKFINDWFGGTKEVQ